MRNLFVLLSFFFTYSLSAQQRDMAEANQIAGNFFFGHDVNRVMDMAGELKLASTSEEILDKGTDKGEVSPAFYIYNYRSSFVIVSGDRSMPEILGYSDSGAFETENIPDNMKAWLEMYAEKAGNGQSGDNCSKLKNESSSVAAEQVEPLLGEIMFDQISPYNLLCPAEMGERTLAGCVAVTIAEIMSYYRFPERGIGNKSYITEKHGYSVGYDFEANPFDWANIANTYVMGNSYSQEEVDAIKNLVYAAGIAVNMDYDKSFSAANMIDAMNGLVKHLGYNRNLRAVNRCNYVSGEWTDMMKQELKNGAPLFYSGLSKSAGHAFVIDGYDSNGLFHVNWGWNGVNNGYFEVFSLSPESTGSGGGSDTSGYKYNQGMILGFSPDNGGARSDSYFEYSSLSFSDLEPAKGESLEITAEQIYNWSYDFYGQIGLFAENGAESVKIGSYDMNETWYCGNGMPLLEISSHIPESIGDGTYQIVVKSMYGGASKWCEAKGNLGTSEYVLTVEGDNCRIMRDGARAVNLDCTFTLTHDLYYARLADADIQVTNNSNAEYYGNIGLAVYDLNNGEYSLVSYLKGEQIELMPGESTGLHVSGYLPLEGNYLPVGNYHIAPAIITNQSTVYAYRLAEPVPVEVHEASGNAGIILSNMKIEDTIVKRGDNINFSIDIDVDARGNVYQGYYTFAFFKSGVNIHQLDSKTIVVGEGKTFNLVDSIDTSELEPALYDMGFYSRRPNEDWSTNYGCGRISIIPGASGLEYTEQEGRPCVILQQEGNIIRLTSNTGIERIDIYNISGLKQKSISTGQAADEITIQTEDLETGIYILEIAAPSGKRHLMKVMHCVE